MLKNNLDVEIVSNLKYCLFSLAIYQAEILISEVSATDKFLQLGLAKTSYSERDLYGTWLTFSSEHIH